MYFYHSYNLYKKFERILLYYIIRKQKFSFFFLFHTKRKHLYSGYKFRYDFGTGIVVKARRILQVWSNVEGMVARGFGESSLTLKPSCILPRTFRQGSAPAHCHLLSVPFLPSSLSLPSHSS